MIDIYRTRRNYYNKVLWWKAKTKEKYNLSDLVENTHYSGFFYAREETPTYNRDEVVSNTFRHQRKEIMLKTNDILKDIEVDDVVKYDNYYWRIVDFQQEDVHKQNEFCKKSSKITYIRIRR